jgi:putative membrane protein
MRKGISILMLAGFVWAACGNDNDNNNTNNTNNKAQLSSAEQNFVQKAALSNFTEVQMGQLAATNANDTLVKTFGQQMVTDHTSANNELQQLQNGYSNVTWPTMLDAQHDSLKTQLDSASGYQFDSLYITSQIADHQMADSLFSDQISNGTTQALKDYASKYLPIIQMHMQKLDSLKMQIIDHHNK